ncbi:MAG: hypothetical protein GW906_07880 [Epsilonproteobacteria bacterium]|nr:hypothetical protein [Campylobacterota bacterium]OIO17978.1 MAG: hypothetical protein AUJ81_00435 [Helicobacteraceae bacterium CG1_02_36_14]PIP09987.1 MAG: hypothetical protein COX50_08085 [Sulfurimonas sp. CG23_combo_of_CG06-09_8_20_14_all_36_33]PIS25226.1 MAG: hypothetical protein COT46_06690 [Sulfurimonas sp. CG08_land_8_20_14_0_20_36_33]PIU35360.1 MAG: hypothetical protein COT05_03745 [Sulfurimonas sp. CG07_land_8_20_14_0_80_36_56]PIV05177.1 MAG: hypothetical protein COS56_02430 [Sulfur
MRKKFLLSLLLAFMLVGCGSTSTSSDGGDDSHSDDENYDDNYNSTNTSSSITVHNQGVACSVCHGPNGREDYLLSAGTVFNQLNTSSANQAASGYSLQALLSTGQKITYRIKTKRGSGNSYVKSSDAPALTSAYDFTGQVVDNTFTVVNASATNSHNTRTHLDCNSCHTETGTNSAPGRITSFAGATAGSTGTGTSTTSTVTAGVFQADVLPIIVANCSTTACHAGGTTGTVLYSSDGNVTASYNNIVADVNTTSPDNSLLLTKAIGTSHSGGTILVTSETRYTTIRAWIAGGAALGTVTGTTATAPTTSTYSGNVATILTNKCNACHSSTSGRTFLVGNYTSVVAQVNTTTPTSSALLQKATNTISHNGGTVFTATSQDYLDIKKWIELGAQNN